MIQKMPPQGSLPPGNRFLRDGKGLLPAGEAGLKKAPTGIHGFDELTFGGLPAGRSTLLTGASGAGKTLFAVEFLVRGATQFGEPGVLMAFEEPAGEIEANLTSLGFDLPELQRTSRLVIDGLELNQSEIVTTGAFDLDGLFIRLASAIDAVGAKRVVLDTIEVLFGALGNESIVRSELWRLLRWLKDRGLTVLATAERGKQGQLTRFGIEEYVSDCVISLDHRVHDEISTRRLRVVKYRGSEHGTNEYPFLISAQGIRLLPLTSLGLSYGASAERVSTGMPDLDEMLGGGVYRGSTVMVSGSAGTGKTTVSAHLVDAACARGERALCLSFEESPAQLSRNMRSVGIDLGQWVDQGLLRIHAERATASGLEAHLGTLHRLVDEMQPDVVTLDAIGSLHHAGDEHAVTATVARQIDLLKSRGITSVLTALTPDGVGESSMLGVSSLADTWLLLRNLETAGERNRVLFVIKSRGMAHSNQVREFVMTDHGVRLEQVVIGPEGAVVGSARRAAVAEELRAAGERSADIERRREVLARRRQELETERMELETERRGFEHFAAGRVRPRSPGETVENEQ